MSGVGTLLVQVLRFLLYAGLYVLLISGPDFVLFNLGWCFFSIRPLWCNCC
jgi:hypothetical protein